MPKKPLFHPNERVDLPDFTRASTDYTDDKSRFDAIKQLLGNRSRLLEGFRIEIPDQVAQPGEFLIYNGNALDAAGRHLNKEDQINDSELHVLDQGDGIYYVEVEFVDEPSDPDDRGLWDPTFVNTPPDLDGKEFSLEVNTRLKPLWRVVTPISVTGFEVTTVPGSTKVPIMELVFDSGIVNISMMPGTELAAVSSVLEEDVSAGSTIKLLNSRLFPGLTNPPSTITVGVGTTNAEAGKTIATNDRDKGLIELGGGGGAITLAHKAGDVVSLTSGTSRFVKQRTEAAPDTTAHPDAAERLFQGNEFRGRALISSKENPSTLSTATDDARDDLNIATLKDQVDALSSIIHEMKFGSRRPDELGTLNDEHFDRLPPHVVTAPRWYDGAGSIMGARTATLTIGDGISTFGDFNGTDHNPFQDAVDSLPDDGGTIYIKGGGYTFTSDINYSNKNVIWAGESAELVTINFTSGGQSMFHATTAASTVFRNLTLVKSGGNQRAIRITDSVTSSIENCVITGEVFIEAPVASPVQFKAVDCILTALDTADRRAVRVEDVESLRMENCTVVGEVQLNGPAGTDPTVRLLDSSFTAAPVVNTSAFRGAGGAYAFYAQRCVFAADSATADQRVIRFEEEITKGAINACELTVRDEVLLEVNEDVNNFCIQNCKMTTTNGGALIESPSGSRWSTCSIDGLFIDNPSGATLGAGGRTEYMKFGELSTCSFRNIRTVSPLFGGVPTDSFLRWGNNDTSGSLRFNNVEFENMFIWFFDTSAGRGITCEGADGHFGPYNVSVRNCNFVGCSTGLTCRKPGRLVVDDCRFQGGLTASNGCNEGIISGNRSLGGAEVKQDIVVSNSRFDFFRGDSTLDTHCVQVTGPDSIAPGTQPPDDLFNSLTVDNCVFSGIGSSSQVSGNTVAAISTELNTRMVKVSISGNEFDRLEVGITGTLRSVYLRADDMGTSGGSSTAFAGEGTFIFDNLCHDQGNDGPNIDNGFIDVSRELTASDVSCCRIHNNVLNTLLGTKDGLFGIRVRATDGGVYGTSICENKIIGIGQQGADDSETSSMIYVTSQDGFLDLQICGNTCDTIAGSSTTPFSSLGGIRVFSAGGANDTNISNNKVLCGPNTFQPIYIQCGPMLGTNILGNQVSLMLQTFSLSADSGITLLSDQLIDTNVSNNNVREIGFNALRSGIRVVSTPSVGSGLVCSGNMIFMPDPGVGSVRAQCLLVQGQEYFNISHNMIHQTNEPPLGRSAGLVLTSTCDFGLIVGNYVTPSADPGVVDSIDFTPAGSSVLALSNFVGTAGTFGTIGSATPAKQSEIGAADGAPVAFTHATNIGRIL